MIFILSRSQEDLKLIGFLANCLLLISNPYFYILLRLELWDFYSDPPDRVDVFKVDHSQRLSQVGSIRHILRIVQEMRIRQRAPPHDILLGGEAGLVLKDIPFELDLLMV